jgi:hypothetical protein
MEPRSDPPRRTLRSNDSGYLHNATVNTSSVYPCSVALTAVKIWLCFVHVNGRRVGSDGPWTWEIGDVMDGDLWRMGDEHM